MNINERVNRVILDLDKIINYIQDDENNENDKNDTDGENNISHQNIKYLEPRLMQLCNGIRKRHLINNENSEQMNKILARKKSKINLCYVCKTTLYDDDNKQYTIYINMCDMCIEVNLKKRDYKKNLTGKIAIVTGGRVKIGFETAIRLLRNNCTVIVTSRFVDDCFQRYFKDVDFDKFKNNLFIYQLNMLDNTNIMKFINYIFINFKKVDYLINNAAQTIKRPKQFYQHVIDTAYVEESLNIIVHRDSNELKILDITNVVSLTHETNIETDLSKVTDVFPPNEFDEFGQQLDLRSKNSWILEPDDIELTELAEVSIINGIAPYILSTKLKPLMTKNGNNFSWIINVTSMEGVFNWKMKSSKHVHTNMAKASLNMFTRTAAQYFIKSNIVMVCVETGWNNSQKPNSYNLKTPLDCIDGASRILDPIYRELKKCGIMYKDYLQHPW